MGPFASEQSVNHIWSEAEVGGSRGLEPFFYKLSADTDLLMDKDSLWIRHFLMRALLYLRLSFFRLQIEETYLYSLCFLRSFVLPFSFVHLLIRSSSKHVHFILRHVFIFFFFLLVIVLAQDWDHLI